MHFNIKTPADWRASTCAALIGCGIGVALGAAYMAGGMARATTDHARASRLAEAAADGFSETVLQREAAAMDPGVLRVASRHDPFTMSSGLDRQTVALTARLDAVPAPAEPIKLRPAFARPAAPYHQTGALESSRELECLTQAVYFEARGETPAGQAAVAQVVLNRVRHPAYPKSVCSVVYQGSAKRTGCQFSFACDGSMRRGREAGAWSRAERVAIKALSGSVMASVGDATHFHATHVAPSWGPRMLRTAEVGLHVFYRFGRDAGRTYVASRKAPAAEPAAEQVYARYTSAPAISAPIEISSDMRIASAVKVEKASDAVAEKDATPEASQPDAPAKVTPTSAPAPAKVQAATPS